MPKKSITFRDQTTGCINNLLEDEHKACASSQNLLGYLAGALLDYKDEGIEFSPVIIFCDDLLQFLNVFPGAVAHTIGKVALDPVSGPKILKDCGPLTGENWFMFIERKADGLANYGVFTYFRLPTAIPLHEGISINSESFCILLRKISSNTIELRGAKGSNLTLVFSTTRESISLERPIEAFVSACCSTLPKERWAADFETYYCRFVETALTASHGTILVCTRDADLTKIDQLKDAIPISPVLDLGKAFAEFQSANSAEGILGLQRCEQLFSGFLRCDGMIVMDTQGRVVAYRAFFKTAAGSGESQPIVGGARRRAFEGVKQLVGGLLESALFRSQDGLTLQQGIS